MKLTLDILTQVIEEYRQEGANLMKALGEKYGYDITDPDQFNELIWRSNPKVPRQGQLSKKVNYAFHGAECGFHKLKNQQNIEVILFNPPHFGKLDAWFVKEFMDSTDAYKEYSKVLNWEDLKPMFKTLYQNGVIQEVK